jgi:pectin methylesterase-like acyl-CoA thioesterase
MRRVIAAILLLSIGLAAIGDGRRTVQAATLTVCASGCQYSTIQAAINDAQNGDTISIGPGSYTENLVLTEKSTPPVTATTLSLVGAGSGQTTISSAGSFNFGGAVLFIDSGYDVSIEGVTIANGKGGFTGGGIINSSNLTLINSAVSDNSARYGAGIYAFGSSSTTLVNSQVTANAAMDTGGGIWSAGTVTLVNSTVSGNSAGMEGGGIMNGGGVVRLHGSTVTDNIPDNCSGTTC